MYLFSNNYHFYSFIYITFKIHDGNQKVLTKMYVQFCEKILSFEGAVMVQTSGACFMAHPVSYTCICLVKIHQLSTDVFAIQCIKNHVLKASKNTSELLVSENNIIERVAGEKKDSKQLAQIVIHKQMNEEHI